ncbi:MULTISPECIES: pyridoxal phosphate-dependent aminotransferase [unclassified Methylobacterium]|uniref:pyridoxal phosphate-dependent aminotransferase n=1 Tax=unclassified Methylobacterium TaxID=2615210 RepID=UPI00037C0C46|nr:MULTISPECIES: pyridoxal phosphate-dependent aminotransferase [unclassified Methylobacterium]SEG71460.1 Aspartate/methionine/tyrosine aminotransferase [Methylobacterium sp. 190mf]
MALEDDAAPGLLTASRIEEPGPDTRQDHGIAPSRAFALAAYLDRWSGCAHHDLAASDSEPLTLAALLRLAGPEERRRWRKVGLGYADPRGAAWLRATTAARYHQLGADDVLISAGAQEAVTCVLSALLGPADHAVVVVPIYQPSELVVTRLCATDGVALCPDRNWSLDLDRLAAAIRPNTRLVLMNFPNSPTGAALDRATLDGLIDLCRRHGLWLVNDEVYRQTELDQDRAVPPVVDLYERGISINGLSKGFGLPGLRVGWAACRDRGALDRVLTAKSLLSSCLAGPSEILAQVALQAEPHLTGRARGIGQQNHLRLRALLDRYPDLFDPDEPTNLAFACPCFRGREGAAAFARALASETGVLVLPSALWHSELASVPTDRLRLGLGRVGSGPALGILADHLRRRAGR